MFGAPPVGHVMDPQFKPVLFWGYGNMYANASMQYQPNWWLGKRKHPDIMYINGRL